MLPLDALLKRLSDPTFVAPGWEATELWDSKREQAKKVLRLFRERFGESDSVWLGFVPGRVEVFGKHTDYAGGHSLLLTNDRGFVFAAAKNSVSRVRMCEIGSEFDPVDFQISPDLQPVVGEWGNYPMTVIRRLARNFADHVKLAGVDVTFASDLPVGSGMSGSSALMIMTFIAVAVPNGLAHCEHFQRNVRSEIDLTMYLACIENGQSFRDLEGGRGVGTFGGSEDHTAILAGRHGVLSLYQFAPTTRKAEISWPQDWQMVVCFSGVRAEKTKQALKEYNRLSERARMAVELYNRGRSVTVSTLREIIDESKHPATMAEALRAKDQDLDLKWDLAGRVVQFHLEDRRFIPAAVQALMWRMPDRFGRLLNCSHDASRRYLGNIASEIHGLQQSTLSLGAFGATGFGAGFGGSLFALVQRSHTQEFLTAWEESFHKMSPDSWSRSSFFSTTPCDGAQEWSSSPPSRWVDRAFS